jgi:2-amino-4-hydroxy-6-hydroxymethyldihydropteridine diphosphokinase
MRALIALGANLGDRRGALERAVTLLRAHKQIASVMPSHWHETPPVGGPPGEPAYLNGAARLETSLDPAQLHAVLTAIEQTLGRKRGQRWSARTIDLDLLLYGQQVIDTPELTVPHPRMAFRRFVLEPAAEVAADMVHPTIGWSVGRLWDHVRTALPYFAIVGPARSGKTALARLLSDEHGIHYLADPAAARSDDTADPPSLALDRQIQFLDCRAAILDRQSWPYAGMPAVSDFYWDQCLAYAQLRLVPHDFATFEALWRKRACDVVTPKLLIVLGSAKPADSEPVGTTSNARLTELLEQLATRREIGPVLHPLGTSLQERFDDVSAAIQAMQ